MSQRGEMAQSTGGRQRERRKERGDDDRELFLKQLNTTKNGQTKAIIESRKIKIVLL